MRKRGPGRPKLPKGQAKGSVLSVRLTPAMRAAVDREAARAEMTASKWAETAIARALEAGAGKG